MSESETNLAIAAECLRQLWQNFDAGGHSMGRSRDSVLLESAMALIPYDHRYASLADNDPAAFDRLHREARRDEVKAKSDEHYREMGLTG